MMKDEILQLDEFRKKFEEIEFIFNQLKKDQMAQINLIDIKIQMLKSEMIRLIQKFSGETIIVKPMNKNFEI